MAGGGGGRYGRNGPIQRRSRGIIGRGGRIHEGVKHHLSSVRDVHGKIGRSLTPSCAPTISWRGRRIGRGGFRVNSDGFRVSADGQLYAPDSEDEDECDIFDVCVPDSEEEAAGDDGVDAVFEAGADGDADLEMEVAGVEGIEEAATGMELDANGAADIEVKEAGEQVDVAPEVAARIRVAVAGMDEARRNIFLSMLQVLVPAFFVP